MKAKILVVDDDPNLRKTLADILRIKGYETMVTGDGAAAVAAVEQGKFSLALIDLMLPDMPGLEVMVRIKAISPLTEVIILTGHASMNTAIEAIRQGAFCYLLKPYKMEELLWNIKQGVERSEAQEEILRLASFPRLQPNPVIELDLNCAVSYLNPAAERCFPELSAQGASHPLLQGFGELIALMQNDEQASENVLERRVGDETYELHISYVREVNLVHIYVLAITQRKRDNAEINLLATTDSLTGIANRREFMSVLMREIERAKRYGFPLSLAMYDLDHFKRVNDSFGHGVGDYVLQTVTGLMKESVRATDVVARWGGEEFMLLMPNSDMQAAQKVAEKLRLAIAEHHFDQVNTLTVSLGVTGFDTQDDQNSLLKRVDDALYLAKENGRNRVEILPVMEALK